MNPATKECRAIRSRLKAHFPQSSTAAIKKATIAFAYGATPAQIAKILCDDAKANALTLEVRK